MCSIARLFFEKQTSIFDDSVDSLVPVALASERSGRDASDIDELSR
jgi:hypothetical protein